MTTNMNAKSTVITTNKDYKITTMKVKTLSIDLDCESLADLEVFILKRNGRTLCFPIWELWQTLERHNDN